MIFAPPMKPSTTSIILPVSGDRKGIVTRTVIAVGGQQLALLAVVVCAAMLQGSAGAQPAPAASGQNDIETGVRVAQLLKDAQRKRDVGKITDALADLRAANGLIKKAKGAGHPDVLPVLDMAGALLFENGQIAEAQTPLGKAVTMREEMIAEGKQVPPVELAAALVMLGRTELLAGIHAEAAERLKRAVGLFESSVGAGHESTLAALEQLANAHFAIGDAEAGEAALGEVLERRRRLRGSAKAGVLPVAMSLAKARAWSGGAAIAIGPLKHAIADHERARLEKALVPPALRQLAELQHGIGDDEAARQSLDRALTMDKAALGDAHATVIIDRLEILRLDAASEGVDAIASAVDPLVVRLQQLAGLADPHAAAGMRAAAHIWLAAQQFGRAAELYRLALETDKRLVGEDHADVAADDAGLGRCLVGNGDAVAALPLFEHARALSTRIRGPRHADTQAVVAAVGDCAAKAGDRTVAEKHLQSLLDAGMPWRSDDDEALLCSLVEGVAALQERAGDRDLAMETRFSLVALRQRQFGEDHARVADVMVRLANARHAAGAFADAVALYELAVAVMEALHGPDHPEVAAILAPLAVSYRALGANEQAEAVLARGLAIWEASVGLDHPVTIASVKPLALVRLALKKDEAALPLMQRLLAAYDADPATPPVDRVKLLKKLAQIHEARGDSEVARGYLERVVEIEAAVGKTAVGKTAGMSAGESGDEVAVDTSKLKRLLTVDEQAEANLTKARSIASSLELAHERLAKVDPRAAAKSSRTKAAPADAKAEAVAKRAVGGDPTIGSVGPKPAVALSAAGVIATALERNRAGRHDEAVGLLRSAIAESENGDANAKGLGRGELAALLIAVADLRQEPLELTESSKLYSRALATASTAVGDSHPMTLVAALRLGAALRAKGDAAGARQLDDLAAANIAAAIPKATKQQVEVIREALRGAAMIALAVDDRAATVRSLDMLLQTGSDLDDRSLLFTLDTVAELLPMGNDDPSVDAVRNRCLQLAKRAAGSRPVLSGLVQHHLSLAEARAGKLPAAVELLEKAAKVDRQTLGQAHPRVACHLLELANLRSRQDDAEGAASLLAEVRQIESRADVATVAAVPDLCRLAAMHTARREFEEAAKLLTAALSAQEKSSDRNSLAIAEIAEKSASLAVARGQSQRARDLLAESAAQAQAGHGGGHPVAVAAMLRRERIGLIDPRKGVAAMADGAKQQGPKPSRGSGLTFAEFLAKKKAESLTARTNRAGGLSRRGPRGPVAFVAVSPTATQPADSLRSGPFEPASRSGLRQRTAIARQRAVDGATTASTTVEKLMLAARSAEERGSRREAIEACEEALSQAIHESGESSLPVADVLDQFATIALSQGNLVRGRQLLERLGSLRWKLLGPADPLVADAAGRLAALLAECGEYERALPLAKRAHEARKKTAATEPVAAAESLVLLGRIDLGRGDALSAKARVEEAARLLASSARVSPTGAPSGSYADVAARLRLVRMLVDVGDLPAASAEVDRLVSDASGGRPLPQWMLEQVLLAGAQVHRAAGDSAGALGLADRLVSAAQEPHAAAVGLVERSMAQRGAADPQWEMSAIESGSVLVPLVRLLSPSATDADAIDALATLAEAWFEAGQFDRANEAVAAASTAASTLPPSHPVAVRVGRVAARLAAGMDAKPQ